MTKDTLTDFVREHVARGIEVRTDGWVGYFDIGRYRFKHVLTNVWPAAMPRTLSHRACTSSPRWSSAGS